MSYKLFFTLFISVVVLCVVSCKKKSNSNPFGNSLIATVSESSQGGVYQYRVVYNAYNEVDSIVATGSGASAGYYGYKVFNYFVSSYSVTDQSGNIFTVNTDANGNIAKVLVQDTLTFIYNGNQLAALEVYMPQASYPYYLVTATEYAWQNGNVMRDSASGPAESYDYDNSKPGQPGDAWRIDQFLQYGQSYIKTNNLLTDEMYSGNWVQKNFYVTDGSGRITQFTKVLNNNGYTVNDTVVYSYTYY